MFEQDYIMRMIHQVIWAMFKLLFQIDVDAAGELPLLPREGDGKRLEELTDMIDGGRIGEAEDIVFDIADEKNPEDVRLVLLFFLRVNDKTDAFLEEHGFTRKELADDLKVILSKYGLDGMERMLLPQTDEFI